MVIEGGTPAQAALFDVVGPADETAAGMASAIRDNPAVDRMVLLVQRLRRAGTLLERARLASEVREVAEELVGVAIRDANYAGATWRQIGVELGVPFQTLFRRYGGAQRCEEGVGTRRVTNSS